MDITTQLNWVEKELRKKGFITRNECLRNYVTRLSAIIFRLKSEKGFEFKTSYIPNPTLFGKDYIYTWSNKPEDEKPD